MVYILSKAQNYVYSLGFSQVENSLVYTFLGPKTYDLDLSQVKNSIGINNPKPPLVHF